MPLFADLSVILIYIRRYDDMKLTKRKAEELRQLLDSNGFSDVADELFSEFHTNLGKLVEIKLCNHDFGNGECCRFCGISKDMESLDFDALSEDYMNNADFSLDFNASDINAFIQKRTKRQD
jgi:hypothetical protein